MDTQQEILYADESVLIPERMAEHHKKILLLEKCT